MENYNLQDMQDNLFSPNSDTFVRNFRDAYKRVIQPAINNGEYAFAADFLNEIYSYIRIIGYGSGESLPRFTSDIVLLWSDLTSKNMMEETKEHIKNKSKQLQDSLDCLDFK